MPKQYPWDHHPDLTADRLIAIGNLIRQARGDALDRHNPDIGDDGWTLGCSAYKFCCFRIIQASGGAAEAWLSITDPSLQFIFAIGTVPVRFYRGYAEEPTSKTCHVSYPELNQLALAFPNEGDAQLLYRFAVETDFDGSITAIKFVGLHGTTPAFCWEVPHESATIIPFPPIGIAEEGVELPAPQVGVPGEDQEEVAEDAS